MPISIMFHLPFLLPTAALLHIGQWAISRTLDLAHCPICWVPPTHPNQMRSFSLHTQKEQIDLLASLGELFAPSSLSFVLLYGSLLVNCVNSCIFSFNCIC